MNRGDARLFLTIISTAIAASVITVIVSRQIPASIDARERALESRVGHLEEAIAELRTEIPPPVPPTPTPVFAEATVQPDPCDEVACVLENYAPACCAKFERPHVPSGAPASLDRASISDGVSHIRLQVMKCGDRTSAKGLVKVSVKVAPSGTVSSVVVKTTPEAKLGACVADRMAHATFAKTEVGGSFSYPFVF